MIDVSEAVVDPDIAQFFTILRSAGVYQNGTWVSETTSIQAFGTVSVAEEHEAVMTPEGDVIHGARVFHVNVPIFATQENVGSSDILVWQGQQYRVLRVANYQDYGYYRAIAVRLSTGA